MFQTICTASGRCPHHAERRGAPTGCEATARQERSRGGTAPTRPRRGGGTRGRGAAGAGGRGLRRGPAPSSRLRARSPPLHSPQPPRRGPAGAGRAAPAAAAAGAEAAAGGRDSPRRPSPRCARSSARAAPTLPPGAAASHPPQRSRPPGVGTGDRAGRGGATPLLPHPRTPRGPCPGHRRLSGRPSGTG